MRQLAGGQALMQSGAPSGKGTMRGYFGIGVEGLSKPMNLGNLLRTTHAFGGSFFFTVAPDMAIRKVQKADTSHAAESLPTYIFDSVAEILLPRGCRLIGVELTEDAVALPSFHHPKCAAYVLGPERGSLSPELQARCDQVVKIPMKFCVNVGIAGALVMYDRLLAQGRHPPRPLRPGELPEGLPEHVHGRPKQRRKRKSGSGENGEENAPAGGGEPTDA